MQSVRAVVGSASDGKPLREFCHDLLMNGVDPSVPLHVSRDGMPYLGVRSIGEAARDLAHFDGILLRKENNDMAKQNGRDRTETGQDDDLPELVEQLLDFCIERDMPPNSPMDEVAEQFLAERKRGGDAGPTRQHLVDDEGPLDGEMVEKIMKHLDGRLSPAALEQLKDMLQGGPDQFDWVPPGLRDKASRDQLERQVEHLDPHSASDALENIEAIELMREHGNLERGVGPRLAERRGTEPWHPGKGEPPGTGLPHPGGAVREPGSLVPRTSRPKPFTASDKRMAGDAALKSFAKLCGVKKKHLPRSI
jgi:hypothetical protein